MQTIITNIKKEQQIINISKDSEQMQCETKWQRLVVVVVVFFVFACLLVCYFLTAVGLDVSSSRSPPPHCSAAKASTSYLKRRERSQNFYYKQLHNTVVCVSVCTYSLC